MGDTEYRKLASYDDGGYAAELISVMSPRLSEVTVKYNIIAAGVTFDDGTRTRDATGDEFDGLGQYRTMLYVVGGTLSKTCHTAKLYQDSQYIGHW